MLLIVFILYSGNVFSHGGGGHGSDICAIAVGPYSVLFKGYQPGNRPRERYCDDFPGLGPSVLTMDLLQRDLRKYEIEVRVIKIKSLLAAQSLSADETVNTVAYLPPKRYSNGMMTISTTFEKPGQYLALIKMEDAGGQRRVGRFPFSVALPIAFLELYLLGAIISMILIGYIVFNVVPGTNRPGSAVRD